MSEVILVTGATGFIGRPLVMKLLENRNSVIAAVRQKTELLHDSVLQWPLTELIHQREVKTAWNGVTVVIHLAARVHLMGDSDKDAYRKDNTEVTLQLAKQAANSGVKRFIFISSVKVNGELTKPGNPFSPDGRCLCVDPYAQSKYDAEQGLLALARETSMEVVIIRPPLVYGSGVKANFASMIKWLNKGVPLPFGAVHNKRSLIALDNLVDFIIHCSDYEKTPQAANQVFLISDGEDVSTTELLRKTAIALGKQARLMPVPVGLMKFGARLLGKEEVANRLFGSLQVDSSKAQNLLGWKPVTTMDEQLKKVAEWYLKGNGK